jgi:hypothetical protein
VTDDPLVPVLTEIVEEASGPQPDGVNVAAAQEALARELERLVLSRLGPELERVIDERLASTVTDVLGQTLEGIRAELTASVNQMVREAVVASVAHTLSNPPQKD